MSNGGWFAVHGWLHEHEPPYWLLWGKVNERAVVHWASAVHCQDLSEL